MDYSLASLRSRSRAQASLRRVGLGRLLCVRLVGLNLGHGARAGGSHALRDGLVGAHGRRYASVHHGVLEALERRALLHLRLLQLAEELVLHALQVHALLLVVLNLFGQVVGLHVDLGARLRPLLANELVLPGHALLLLLADHLLAVLRVVVGGLAHAVQVVAHLLLLAPHLLHHLQLLVLVIFVSEQQLLLLLVLALALGLTLRFQPLQLLRIVLLLLNHLVVVLDLEVL